MVHSSFFSIRLVSEGLLWQTTPDSVLLISISLEVNLRQCA